MVGRTKMTQEITKGRLAKVLSQLKVFENPKISEEQYPTDSEIAAEILWNSAMIGDFDEKVIVDLGAGTGILGIGALLLGAKKITFVEKDSYALGICKENYQKIKSEFNVGDAEFTEDDVSNYTGKAEVVIQNPPFGTKEEHVDKVFLEKAFETASVVYSFHKASTKEFIQQFASQKNFRVTHYWEVDFPLKATQKFHTRQIHRIKVGVFRFEKSKAQNL